MNKVEKLLKNLNIDYKNIDIYVTSLTHTSYINEKEEEMFNSYERLEFLGDSVLGLSVSNWLYEHTKERMPGEMTLLRSNVVSKKSLARISEELKLNKYALLGKGEDRNSLSDSVLEDFLEALIGAIYIDLGIERAMQFVDKYISIKIANLEMDNIKDHKTKLQEHLQAENRSNVEYETINEVKDKKGQITFEVNVMFEGIVLGTGTGVSKKKAEQAAAASAYSKLVK